MTDMLNTPAPYSQDHAHMDFALFPYVKQKWLKQRCLDLNDLRYGTKDIIQKHDTLWYEGAYNKWVK